MTFFDNYSDPLADHISRPDPAAAVMHPAPRPAPSVSSRPSYRPAPTPPRPSLKRDPSPGSVPMPAGLSFSILHHRDALAAGMTEEEVHDVLVRLRTAQAGELRTPRQWGSTASAAIMEAIRAHRAGTTPPAAPEPIEPAVFEPEAAPSAAVTTPPKPAEQDQAEPDEAYDYDHDLVPDEPAWFRDMYSAGLEAIDEAANDDDLVPPMPPVDEDPADVAEKEETAAADRPKRKSRTRTEKPKRLTSFEYSDRAAWVTAVNLERGMSVAGMKAAAFLGLVHNGTTGVSFYGQSRMARMMGTSRSTTQAGIDALVKAGFLGRERVWREGRQNSNRYVIQMPEKVAKFRRTDTFIDSFGPEIRDEHDRDSGRDDEENDRDSGHGGEDQCPGFRASDDRDSGRGMTEIPGTNKGKGTRGKNEEKKLAGNFSPIDETGSVPPQPETVQPSRASRDVKDRGQIPMPPDLTFSAASLALARAAGLTGVDIEAAMTSFREKFGTERRTRAAWESAIAGWLKRQRPAPKVQGAEGRDGPRHDRRGTPLDDTSIPGSFYERENIRAWLMSAKGLHSAEAVRDAVRRFNVYYRQEMTGDMALNADWPAALFQWLKWQDAIAFATKHQGHTPKRMAV